MEKLIKQDMSQKVLMISEYFKNHANPDFPYRFTLYQKLAKKEDVNVVNNSGSIEDSVRQVMETLISDKSE